MESFILSLCNILKDALNYFICIVAVVELGFAILSGISLWSLRKWINKINKKEIRRVKTEKTGKGKQSIKYEGTDEQDWDVYDNYLRKYQKNIKWYDFFALIIQILPLLGMLGTVAGLYIAINEGQNIYEGVGFALSSTVFGILFAILFKVVEMFFIALFIRHIDEGMDRFEKVYQVNHEEAE